MEKINDKPGKILTLGQKRGKGQPKRLPRAWDKSPQYFIVPFIIVFIKFTLMK